MLTYFVRLFRSLTEKEKIGLYICSLLAILSGILTTWSFFRTHTVIAPAPGGEYVEGVIGQPTAINPMQIGSSPVDKDLTEALFADLFSLTERYATSSTGKVWVITLKENLLWSDGKPLTSDDVIFTVQTIQHPDASSPLFASWQGINVERISELQIRFTLKAPYSYFLDSLKNLRIAPAHIFEPVPITNIRLSNYNLEPVSSGPYVFSGYEKRKDGFITNYRLTANPNYAGKKALIEKFTFSFFPTYVDALIAFNHKQIDGLGGISPERTGDIKINHSLYELALPNYYALFFNPTIATVFKDKNVREALELAIDRNAIIEETFGEHAIPVFGPIPPALSDYSSSTYKDVHNSAVEAKALLAKQGWRIGQDGVQARNVGKNIQRLDVEIATPDISFLVKTAEIIKLQLQEIGVKATIKIVAPELIEQEVIRPRSYQILLFGNILRANSDLFSFWHSSQRFQPGLNLAMYENKTVDKLIESARSTFDENARKEAIQKIQNQIAIDRPAIFLYSPHYLYASPTNLGGVNQSIIGASQDRLANVANWYLETARIFKKNP
jgi:peptide/nickel transport system substrate-binding protein